MWARVVFPNPGGPWSNKIFFAGLPSESVPCSWDCFRLESVCLDDDDDDDDDFAVVDKESNLVDLAVELLQS